MRRFPIAVFIATLAVPASAEAGTLALEGTELVYRASPGAEDVIGAEQEAGRLTVEGLEGGTPNLTAGAGCERAGRTVRCSLAQVTAVRVLAGDGDDILAVRALELPLTVDLGPGSDDLDASAPSLALTAGDGSDRLSFAGGGGTVDLGPGEDFAELSLAERSAGPLTVEGGEGRDLLFATGASRPGVTLSGGADDDELHVQTAGHRVGLDVACGPGSDTTSLRLVDRPGDGCAAHVAVPAPQRVSRAFKATLSAPARGTVEFHRDPQPARRGFVRLARVAYSAQAGPLRARLKTTRAGRRWIRRDPDLRLFVTVKTRTGGDRSEVSFPSRLGE